MVLRAGLSFAEVIAREDGVLRSAEFPGLWLDVAALFLDDGRRFREVLEQGLQSPEHAAFVANRVKPSA